MTRMSSPASRLPGPAAMLAGIVVAVCSLAGGAQSTQPLSAIELGAIWDTEHVSPPLPPLVDHEDVLRRLSGAVSQAPDLFAMEKAGESIEGRSINYVRVGTGPFAVLLWSQMHGDESTATSALFDVLDHLRRRRTDPVVARILARLTLHVVPMLNPDGAERFERRNAQSIDINRDALRLQTPEGKVLKALRDRLQPRIGFNLHNQSWRTSVGRPPQPASISLLSVAFDEPRTENAGRRLTKQICAVIRDALEPLAPGQIGRYDDEFEVRAFGDNITLWGTPVVLIETGPWPGPEPDAALVRLNFVAIVSALDALATGAVDRADPARYDALPMNESKMLSVIVRNATVINGKGIPPFIADIGLLAARRVQVVDGRRELQTSLTVDDVGDLRTMGALRTVDATGMTAIPLVDETTGVGQLMDLPEWKATAPATIAVGQPARIVLLKPSVEPGTFVVEAILR
jgi:Zinc carboxypeptidase